MQAARDVIQVQYPNGKHPQRFAAFMLANSVFLVCNVIFDAGLWIYLIVVGPFVPFLVLSLKSAGNKYTMELAGDGLTVDGTRVLSTALAKISFMAPRGLVILYQAGARKQVLHLRVAKSDSGRAPDLVREWCLRQGVPHEMVR